MLTETEAGADLRNMASTKAEEATMCPESLTMIKATEAPELHFLPQVMFQLILTLLTEHHCIYLKTSSNSQLVKNFCAKPYSE